MCAGDTGHGRAGHIARAVAGAQRGDAARAFGIPAYGLHLADLLQVLVDAASDADLRTGQRVTVLVQHDWSGKFGNQRIAELGQQATRPAVPDPPDRQ